MTSKTKILEKLTGRELVIMQHYMKGKKYQEISQLMDISRCSVKNAVYSVVKKLNANNAIHSAAILASIIECN